jgi:WS/DGAT/MGAT family acyltransferase
VPLTAPRITLNGAITPHRKIAFADVSLADLKIVKDAFGVKVNDVVLAIATSALRTYLAERGELPDRPLVATIPTSVRTAEQKHAMGNRVSAMFAALPVELEDPLERLHAIHESTIEAKEIHEDIGGETLQDWAEVVAPAIFSRAMKAYSSLRLADRHRPLHNLVVSNVPGPPFPIYFGGARLESFYPLGPIFDGAGLNLTVISYLDSVGFGFLACRELAPDIDRLAAAVSDALEELVKLANAGMETIVLDEVPDPASVMEVVRPRRPAIVGATGFDRVAPRSAPTS